MCRWIRWEAAALADLTQEPPQDHPTGPAIVSALERLARVRFLGEPGRLHGGNWLTDRPGIYCINCHPPFWIALYRPADGELRVIEAIWMPARLLKEQRHATNSPSS